MATFEIDDPAVIFVIGLVISTVIIFAVTALFRGRPNIGKAFITALVGTLVWVVTYYLFGHGLLATVVGGIVWLFALRGIYGLSWTRSAIIAVIIWIVSYFVTVALGLPTTTGPL
ncbi:MAG TPA: hypothetical protein VJ772_07320 [Nitrososphaeraceae archaeon]|jgi:hypothetical protein|nr:hypothetical protein [Nitrososphaeraceae archaeon]